MARTPEMVEGYRTPRADAVAAAEAKPRPGRIIPEGKTMFQFKGLRYRVQLTAPENSRLPDGTILRGAKPLVVVAEEGFKLLDNVKDALAIKKLKEHQHYKIDFWDFQDKLDQQQAEREASALATLQDSAALQNPEVRAKVIALLKQSSGEDFELPGAGAKKPAKTEAARI